MQFNNAGLSLDQAPPFHVPFRFFITAPVFGLAAVILILGLGPDIFINRFHQGILAITHLLTLGLMTMIMLGALFQMMPVLAGSVVPRQHFFAPLIHVCLSAGTIGLVGGFLLPVFSWWKWLSLTLLLLGLGSFISISGYALFKSKSSHTTVRYMRHAILALTVTAALGAYLGLGHIGYVPLQRPGLTDLHLQWGFIGWVFLLIFGVSLQVIPMFQVTPRYPPLLAKISAPLVLSLLLSLVVVWAAKQIEDENVPGYFENTVLFILLALLTLFIVVTLWLQKNRKRKRNDILVWYGRLAFVLAFLAIFCAVLPAQSIWGGDEEQRMILVGVFLLSAVTAYMCGMLYKIVPFLVWFHLQAQQMQAMMAGTAVRKIPLMHEIVREKYSWWQFSTFILGILFLIFHQIGSFFFYLGGISLLISFSILTIQLIKASLIYKQSKV